MKQILLYSPIFSFTAETFIEKMDSIDKKEPITMRVNGPGGSVFAGWGMVRSMIEHEGEINYKVDGIAASMHFYLLLFADKTEALDVSRFLIHRADGYVENEDQKKELRTINAQIREKLQKRVQSDIFKQVTGVSFDELFDENQRKNVWIGAKEAKKIGLIDKIVRLDPKEIEAMNETFYAFSEYSQGSEEKTQGSVDEKEKNKNKVEPIITKKMTKAEFKAQNPEAYAEIFNEGIAAGTKAEQIRVKSWLAFLDIDKENVIASIKDNKEFTPDVQSEMIVKMQAKKTVDAIADDSKGKISTSQAKDKTEEQQEIEAFEKEVKEGVKNIKLY